MTLQSTPATELTDEELMLKYDIKRVPTDRFHHKSFRYSRLDDALRQAMRDQPPA
ncbi:hypothetical protein [Sphingobium chlorophenolicum]|uniref:Uncharacterized protein n=1 Tax=Sphingobium chlorophenolicum TaxID=46429 RepID=A0A081R847_SPHCR|nr:hypothetical protein [Sphingobium chlorophenolicum]KEQ51370.1 hypothetical protein BV95_04372 [Sphingobium chlorophenolicum]